MTIQYISNSLLEVGCDSTMGGALTVLLDKTTGRQFFGNGSNSKADFAVITAGTWGDPSTTGVGTDSNGDPWPWNPNQAGADYDNGGGTIAATSMTNDGTTIYSIVSPPLWEYIGAMGQDLDLTVEQWTTILNNNVIHLKYKVTNNGIDRSQNWQSFRSPASGGSGPGWSNGDDENLAKSGWVQESPAVCIGDSTLTTIWPSTGISPLPSADGNLSSGQVQTAALLDSTGYGIGVYNPTTDGFIIIPGNYISPQTVFGMIANCIYNYDVYLAVGTINQISSAFNSLASVPGAPGFQQQSAVIQFH